MFWGKVFKCWKWYVGFISFSALFYAGWNISQKSWNEQFFVNLRNMGSPSFTGARNIANVKQNIKVLKNKKVSNQKALVQSSQVDNQKDTIQFYLGHFLVKSTGGEFVLACQKYKTVDMTFIAAGVSSHGHVPKMILKAGCAFNSEKPLQIGPFVIPKRKILESSIDQQLFKGGEGTLLFSHVVVQWPREWILSQVRFIGDSTEDMTVPFVSNQREDFLTFHLK